MTDDLDARLRAWGTAEAAAAGEPPPFALGAPRRRAWLPALAAAAVLVVAAGGGLVLAHGRSPRPAPAPAAAPGVVPWADLPASPDGGLGPTPAASTPAGVRTCRAADLRASQPDRGQGATGNWVASIVLTNASRTPCLLTGRLDAASGVVGGVRRPLALTEGSSLGGVAPVVLAPAASGRVTYAFYQRCDTTQPPVTPVYRDLRITLLGGTLPVPGADISLGCGRPELQVSALGGDAPQQQEGLPAWAVLEPTIEAPASVRAGDVLRYRVVLTNPTDTDVPLDACPNLLQALGSAVKRLWALNCAAAGPVPAQGSETFAMELAVPGDAPVGGLRLVWSLAGPGTTPAGAAVEVTGGTPEPTAATCVPDEPAPPCGPGMQPGRSYPYVLYTHCGARDLIADGRRWALIGDLPDPGFRDPLDTGQVVLDKPGVRLTYRSDAGGEAHFGPAAPTGKGYAICH